MTVLNQIVAVVNGKKTKAQNQKTDQYRMLAKPDLFNGLARTYRPSNEDGETFPAESKMIQVSAHDVFGDFWRASIECWDLVATQDINNCSAKANIVVDGKLILPGVPVTTLLFIEKQLEDVRTFIGALPTLRPEYKWEWNAGANCYAAEPERTNKTKKVKKSMEVSPATKEHPAQVTVFDEDVKIGEWELIRFSSAIQAEEKQRMLDRVEKLRDAVKFAREEANGMEIEQTKIAGPLQAFIMEDVVAT